MADQKDSQRDTKDAGSKESGRQGDAGKSGEAGKSGSQHGGERGAGQSGSNPSTGGNR